MIRRIHPDGAELSADEAISGLGLGELAPPNRPYVVLNMVSSADGRASLEGRSAPLSSDADRELFHHLRTQADAVLVGAGTVRTERYGRLVRDPELRAKREREGLAPDPLACIVSARVALGADIPILDAPEQRVLVITQSPDGSVSGEPRADVGYLRVPTPGEGLRRLRVEHGVRSVLCEGGPTLNASLFAEEVVDELFLTLAPLVAGGEDPLTAVSGPELPEPARLELVSVLEADGALFLRYRMRR